MKQVYIIKWAHGYLNQKKLKPEHVHESTLEGDSVEGVKKAFRRVHPGKIRILSAKPTGIRHDENTVLCCPNSLRSVRCGTHIVVEVHQKSASKIILDTL